MHMPHYSLYIQFVNWYIYLMMLINVFVLCVRINIILIYIDHCDVGGESPHTIRNQCLIQTVLILTCRQLYRLVNAQNCSSIAHDNAGEQTVWHQSSLSLASRAGVGTDNKLLTSERRFDDAAKLARPIYVKVVCYTMEISAYHCFQLQGVAWIIQANHPQSTPYRGPGIRQWRGQRRRTEWHDCY